MSTEIAKQMAEVVSGLKTWRENVQKQVDAIDIKLAEHHISGGAGGELIALLEKNDGIQRLLTDKKGAAVITIPSHLLERKTAITSSAVGAATSGVLQIDRIPGIVPAARPVLTIRNVLTARPTLLQIVDFVKVNVPLAGASPQTEASAKYENAATFTTTSETIRTIATWIPASKQILDDFSELLAFLQSGLAYAVDHTEEVQILSGDNTGQNLHGLIPQASSFDTGLLVASAGWNRIDIIGRAAQQIQAADELPPTFFAVHPDDWWSMRLTKDSFGEYVLGPPMAPANAEALFGLQPLVTTNITTGTFLVGSGDPAACEIRDRQETTVEISTQHSDYFTKNMIAIRAEKRLALIVKRPASYITGSFSTSPA